MENIFIEFLTKSCKFWWVNHFCEFSRSWETERPNNTKLHVKLLTLQTLCTTTVTSSNRSRLAGSPTSSTRYTRTPPGQVATKRTRLVGSPHRGRYRAPLGWVITNRPQLAALPQYTKLRARNYKRNLLVRGTSSPKIYLSERLRACPDLLATDQLNYQSILQNLSWGQVPFKSTCPWQ